MKARNQIGFTLVELAIVLMIIGLLIGGILRGQELLQNARVTATINQLTSYNAAVVSFRDAYSALPGDMINPGARLPNCQSAPCNTPGNGNGIIGVANSMTSGNENNTFWLHLAAINLITGIDKTMTWESGNYGTANFPENKLGGMFNVRFYQWPVDANYLEGMNGHYWIMWAIDSGGTPTNQVISLPQLAKLDRKIDDGRPWNGDAVLGSVGCNVAQGAQEYDANNTRPCILIIKSVF